MGGMDKLVYAVTKKGVTKGVRLDILIFMC